MPRQVGMPKSHCRPVVTVATLTSVLPLCYTSLATNYAPHLAQRYAQSSGLLGFMREHIEKGQYVDLCASADMGIPCSCGNRVVPRQSPYALPFHHSQNEYWAPAFLDQLTNWCIFYLR